MLKFKKNLLLFKKHAYICLTNLKKDIMKILKYLLWTPIIAFVLQLILGMFLIIWEPVYNKELFAKTWFTFGLIGFICLCILSSIDKTKNDNNNGKK